MNSSGGGAALLPGCAMPGNEPSQSVALRAGFRQEGLLRRWGEVNGEQLDWAMFSLIREDLAAEGNDDA